MSEKRHREYLKMPYEELKAKALESQINTPTHRQGVVYAILALAESIKTSERRTEP